MTPRINWPDPARWIKLDINLWDEFKRAQFLAIRYPGCLKFFRNRVFVEAEAMELISFKDLNKIKTPTVHKWKELSALERREVLTDYNTEKITGKTSLT